MKGLADFMRAAHWWANGNQRSFDSSNFLFSLCPRVSPSNSSFQPDAHSPGWSRSIRDSDYSRRSARDTGSDTLRRLLTKLLRGSEARRSTAPARATPYTIKHAAGFPYYLLGEFVKLPPTHPACYLPSQQLVVRSVARSPRNTLEYLWEKKKKQ